MKPVKFKESNVIFAVDQPEYLPLPAFRDLNQGSVVSCWKLGIRERIKMLFTGKVWLGLLTFNKPLQPIYMSVDKLVGDVTIPEEENNASILSQ